MKKVYVIIRTLDEKTLPDCIKAVEERGFDYYIAQGCIPLEKAARRTLEVGSMMEEYDWVIALDADVILTASRKEIEDYCKYMERVFKKLFCFTTWVEDTKRGVIPGVHFYKRNKCSKAWHYAIQKVFGGKIPRKAESEMVYWLHMYKGLRRVTSGHKQFIIGKHIWEENNK